MEEKLMRHGADNFAMPEKYQMADNKANNPAMPTYDNKANYPMVPLAGSNANVPVMPMHDNKANVPVMPFADNRMYDNKADIPMTQMHDKTHGGRREQLAVAYVNKQRGITPRYDAEEALERGTLFPELDLPFLGYVKHPSHCAGTPHGELTAIAFVAHELVLYLDTHKDDREAFAMLQHMLKLKKEAHKRYVERYGPISIEDLECESSYTWTRSPWPWDLDERSGK